MCTANLGTAALTTNNFLSKSQYRCLNLDILNLKAQTGSVALDSRLRITNFLHFL